MRRSGSALKVQQRQLCAKITIKQTDHYAQSVSLTSSQLTVASFISLPACFSLLWLIRYLLRLIFLLLFEEISEIDELLHGLHLPAQVLQIHATGPAVRLQQQAEALAHRLVVHL